MVALHSGQLRQVQPQAYSIVIQIYMYTPVHCYRSIQIRSLLNIMILRLEGGETVIG